MKLLACTPRYVTKNPHPKWPTIPEIIYIPQFETPGLFDGDDVGMFYFALSTLNNQLTHTYQVAVKNSNGGLSYMFLDPEVSKILMPGHPGITYKIWADPPTDEEYNEVLGNILADFMRK